MSVCVTGGTSGIGRAIAERLARPGADVFLNYRSNQVAAKEAAKSIEDLGAIPHLIQADVGTVAGVQHLAQEISSVTDHLTVMVHAAAMAAPGSLLDMSADVLDQAVATNGTSLAHLVRESRHLYGQGSNIVFVTSAGSSRALKDYGALGAPKALAEHFARYLAVELAADGIRVNCVSPGPLDTEARRRMFPDTWEARLAAQSSANPSGRGLEFDDVAGVVELLCRREFDMVQGQVITVDGGLTL